MEVQVMKESELKFTSKKERFLKDCLFNPAFPEAKEIIENYLLMASDTKNFIDLVLSDKTLKNTQAYAVLSRNERQEKHWYKVREMFGEKEFKTESDAGSVKIGNSSFSVLISNGCGDGTTRVAIFDDEKEFNSDMMDFQASINGCFNIYSYDCGNDVVINLNGRYGIYSYQGFVAFENWD
jgi:hypothetical protein